MSKKKMKSTEIFLAILNKLINKKYLKFTNNFIIYQELHQIFNGHFMKNMVKKYFKKKLYITNNLFIFKSYLLDV